MCIPAFHDWQCAEVPNEFSLVYLFFSTDLFYWGCFSSWHAGGGGGAVVVVVLVAVAVGGGVAAGTRSQKQCEWPPLSSTHLSLPLATHLERRQTQGQTWGHKGIMESIQTQNWTTFLKWNHNTDPIFSLDLDRPSLVYLIVRGNTSFRKATHL